MSAGRDHMPALDGLRGLAAWLVVAYHGSLVAGLADLSGLPGLAGRLFQSGWIGVDLFFALSGFLVTGILLRDRGRAGHLGKFFLRRGARIVPLYMVTLAVMLHVLPGLLGPHSQLASSLRQAQQSEVFLWTFTINLWMAFKNQLVGGALEPCWSLCVEVHYYLLWPALVGLLSRRRLVTACVVLLLAFVALRAVLFLGLSVDARAIYFATPTRLDAVVAGTLFAALKGLGDESAQARFRAITQRVLLAGMGVLGTLFVIERGLHERSALTVLVGYSAIAISSGAAVSLASRAVDTGAWAVLCRGPLSASGRYSYALYLFNLPALTVAAEYLDHDLWARPLLIVVLGALTSWVMAVLSYRLIEQPCLRLSHRKPAPKPA